MTSILFLAPTESDGSLSKPALEALTAARQLKDSLGGDLQLVVGLIGTDIQAAADKIASCGADQFVSVTGPEFGVSRYSTDSQAIAGLVKATNATIVLAPATSRVTRVLPGAAQRCGGCIDTQVAGISVDGGKVQIQRWYYRQRMVATLSRDARPWFLSIAPGIFDTWQGDAGTANVESVTVELDAGATRTKVVGTKAADTNTQTIRPEADLLIVAGAGWTKKQSDGQSHVPEAEVILLEFLNQTQASLGSSKSLVDQDAEGQQVMGFLSHMNQVGQTGSTPRHPKGLATCCHGEEPHVVGWRFIHQRRAVNTDANCSWAQGKADVLYVADAFEVMKKVNELLANG
ncbi:electron transfer flavoprotein subunit alpha/FixB family protein [Novipirellula artificiosorum]|uniref:Electron transfer flavoprotein subunit alpha n=1 Tax=Novipirellula artificiosorum TaxID=2528016 RepID=A0A5C6DXT5_9BACT|nr:FAD-binding protein [Novipirellula artificiosorum]TWU42253.1 Electron transfer flavoprotein subunit alpha [Novipirellula artificiosorum]